MNWMDMTLREYQAALASSSPTPGGGTAAAVALGQALQHQHLGLSRYIAPHQNKARPKEMDN